MLAALLLLVAAPAFPFSEVIPVQPASSAGEATAPRCMDADCWADSAPEQDWDWDRYGGLFDGSKLQAPIRRLVRWLPDNPPGSRRLYDVLFPDGGVRRLNETELAAEWPHAATMAHNPGDPSATFGLERRTQAQSAWLEKQACIAEHRGKGREAVKEGGYTARTHDELSVLDCDPAMPLGQRRVYDAVTITDGKIVSQEVYRASPLVFDLGDSGPQTTARTVLFDLEGSGKKDSIQWINDLAPNTGLLVFDGDGDGKAGESGREVFGDRTDLGDGRKFDDGFAALRGMVELAVRHGVLPASTLEKGRLDAADLAVLEKTCGLAMKIGGFNKPAVSLRKAGIKGIALSRKALEPVEDFDSRSNVLVLQKGAVFLRDNGAVVPYADVWLSVRKPQRLAAR